MKNLEAGDDIDDLRETFQHLQRANVNVYTFDPRGLTMEGISSPKLDSSRTFAESTGGRAVLGTNAPWEHVDQVFQENSSYYLLGIQPTNTASDGRFRRLTVRANHPDVEVRTRSGYFAASNEKPGSKPAPPVTALDKAFGAALPTGNLPLSLTVAPFPVPGRKQSALAIVVGTERRVSNQPTTETLEVIATAFDTDVRARATHRQTVELSLEPGMGGQGRFDLYSRLMLSPGRYEVRVGAQGPRGAGGVFTSVDVPDFTKSGLTLSGLVLGRPRPDEDRSSDVLADLIPVKPLHKRSFSEAERVYAFLRVNQGGKDPLVPVSITSRIVDSATRDVFSDTTTLEAERFRSHRVADYRLELPLARLGAGQYLLTIEVPASKKPLRRDVRFTVK
jgi:hypothetical protein